MFLTSSGLDLAAMIRLFIYPWLRYVLVLLMFGPVTAAVMGQVVETEQLQPSDIESPRPGGWTVDLTGRVSTEAVENINRVCEEINQRLDREMCVVVVHTTNGQNHRAFATELFNHWGVGKSGIVGTPGKWRDNGILLFAALDDQRAELILGDGIDSPQQTLVAQQIIDDVVVPNFKQGHGNSALYEGIRACATRIFAVADLDAPAVLPSVSGQLAPALRKHRRRGPVTWWPWILGGSAVGGVGWLISRRVYRRYRPRHCEKCGNDMVRLREDEDDQFLDDPEKIEERLGSVDYDVWACLGCEEVVKIRYGKLFTRYSKCPQCWYITVHKIEQVLIRANYQHGGRVRVVEECQSCDFRRHYTYATPQRVAVTTDSDNSGSGGSSGSNRRRSGSNSSGTRSSRGNSSGSNSSRGSSSRGSSSRRSSGFGGGKSSGGGAGGGW